MLIKSGHRLTEAHVTDRSAYLNRRQFLRDALALSLVAGTGTLGSPNLSAAEEGPTRVAWRKKMSSSLATVSRSPYSTSEAQTPLKDVLRYNNFYEFGVGKEDPVENSQGLSIDPWSVAIEGEVAKPGQYHLEDLVRPQRLEERIYRLRCVEAWSMVIPWIGFPLGALLRRVEPTSKARYVVFETLVRPDEMLAQRSFLTRIDWPYREGLRLDEAMHPLTLMAVGLYGDILPNQNGAPLRLVVPWKYGFKSIKSIVKIRLTQDAPVTTWNRLAPQEYGFYANVNPAVDHPRWSQKTERRLPGGLFSSNKIETLPFNGYGEQVASLYTGMDLARNY